MADEKHICIATPMYGGMCSGHYTVGMLDSLDKLKDAGFKVNCLYVGNESLITRARNQLVHQFLTTTNAKYFLFVDADIGFNGEDVLKLINSDKELICGLYPKKLVDWERVNKASQAGEKDLEKYAASYVVNTVALNESHLEPLKSSVVEIRHGGTGFMLIHRSVFEKLSPYVKEYRISSHKNPDGTLPPLVKEFFALDIVPEDKFLLSEDYFFCDLWAKHGGKIYADLSIRLSHFGSYEYKGDLFVGGANPGNK